MKSSVDWIALEKIDNRVNISTAQYLNKGDSRMASITIYSDKYQECQEEITVTQTAIPETYGILLYTSYDGKVVNPYKSNVFGANILSNIYQDNQGLILFDNPITSIGSYAFSSRGYLTSVTIPEGVTSIGSNAFRGCSSLTSITIPEGVTSIGSNAFYGCSSLTSITIPDSVISIGEDAFCDCSSLNAFYGKYASDDNRCLVVDGVLVAFASSDLTEYSIPNSVTSIGSYAFSGCSRLTSVTIPDGVTSIENYAFSSCHSLTSVTIGNSVTSIRSYAFIGCSSLTSVTIPDSVTSIENSAFIRCSSLTSVTIGNSVTSISTYAFSSCRSLTSVYCKPTTPPSGARDMFDSNAPGRTIYVPRNSVDAYKTASYWSDYESYIVGYDFE